MRRRGGLGAGLAGAVLVASLVMGSTPDADAYGVASDGVEYVTTVPLEAGAPTGGRLVGKYFYVAGPKGFSIYDVSDPVAPQLVSTTPTGVQFPNEDVDTNGKVLLVSNEQLGATLQVWDVRDKAAPVKLAELSDVPDHTFTCVLNCRWAYGARGSIVDLRDPSSPKLAGNWSPGARPDYAFDVTEVKPGLVLTSSRIIHLLDARKNPAKPKAIAHGGTTDNRLIHSNRWPRKGKEDFFLVQGETPFSQRCNDDSGAFMTWDASRWKRTKSFTLIDEYRVENGAVLDGNPPAHAFGCTAMWFQEHPRFKKGGLVAVAFFEHGVRFLRVDAKGKISERGHFMPYGGSSIASYWITDEIVYSLDLYRGIDILRVSTS